MTRETKVGLLVGMGVILLIGIIVSDHLSMAQKQTPPDMTDYGSLAQNSLNAEGTGLQTLPASATPAVAAPPAHPLPTPEQFDTRTAQANTQPPRAQSYGAPAPAVANQSAQDAVTAAMDSHIDSAVARAPAAAPASPAQPFSTRQLAAAAIRSNADFDTASLASKVAVVERPGQGPQPSIHYVQRGETLYAIAARYYNNGDLWPIIQQANRNVVHSDNTVNLGARLIIPNKALVPELIKTNPQAAGVLEPVTNESQAVSRNPATTGSVVVKPGDTLSGLASEYLGSSRRWKELLAANKDKLDKPQDLRVGMTINLPKGAAPAATTTTPAAASTSSSATPARTTTAAAATANAFYVVKAGDTLSRIAQERLGDSGRWDSIYQANRDQLKNANDLAPGMKIKIPVQR